MPFKIVRLKNLYLDKLDFINIWKKYIGKKLFLFFIQDFTLPEKTEN